MDEETRMALDELGLTPEQIESIMQLGVLAGEAPMQQRMEAQGSGLRRNPMTPGPRGRWTGRTYTAAHPMEFAAGALGSGIGAYQEQQARDRQQELLQEQADLRKQYMMAQIAALKSRGAGTPREPGTTSYPLSAAPAGTPNTGFNSRASGPGPTSTLAQRIARMGGVPLR